MLTNFQNASNLGQYSPVKRPPGSNSVNNGVSGKYVWWSRASFSHGSDNALMPIGSGYGRNNSISIISQSVMVVVRRV